MSRFQTGVTYPLKDPESYDDEYGQGYAYAQSYGNCDGMIITDCWIVDKDGNIHPGMDESPVPVHIDDVDTEAAFHTQNHQKSASWA